jgi:putative endonuclease
MRGVGAVGKDKRRELGSRGEQIAARHLERQGWRIVERNYRSREGELDLIATRRGTLAFCEVKTIVARGPGHAGPADPIESVGALKQMRVRRMARVWLTARAQADALPAHRSLRLDVIGVVLSAGGELVRLEHLEGAF